MNIVAAGFRALSIFFCVLAVGASAGFASLLIVGWDGRLSSHEMGWPFMWAGIGASALPVTLWLVARKPTP